MKIFFKHPSDTFNGVWGGIKFIDGKSVDLQNSANYVRIGKFKDNGYTFEDIEGNDVTKDVEKEWEKEKEEIENQIIKEKSGPTPIFFHIYKGKLVVTDGNNNNITLQVKKMLLSKDNSSKEKPEEETVNKGGRPPANKK